MAESAEPPPTAAQLQELHAKVESSGAFEDHAALVDALRRWSTVAASQDVVCAGLRRARQAFAKAFPLPPAIWTQWIEEEKEVGAETELIDQLYAQATEDYLDVELWCSYAEWSASALDEEAEVRRRFETALTAAGGVAATSGRLWEAYRTWESVKAETAEEGSAEAEAGRGRVDKLFRRQLVLPLKGNDEVWAEYAEWLEESGREGPGEDFAARATAAQRQWDEVYAELEAELASDPSTGAYNAHKAYIQHETESQSDSSPERVVWAFERALAVHCLNAKLWLRYLGWLRQHLGRVPGLCLKTESQSDSSPERVVWAFERALAVHCLNAKLWLRYLGWLRQHLGRVPGLCLKTESQSDSSPERVVWAFERALAVHCLNAKLWLRYLGWLRQHLGRVPGLCLKALRRAVRNVAWSADVWRRYLDEVERSEPDSLRDVFKACLSSGCTGASLAEASELWQAAGFALKRLGAPDEELAHHWQDGRAALRRDFGAAWDPEAKFRSSWAEWCGLAGRLAEGRAQWDDVLREAPAQARPVLQAVHYEMRHRARDSTDWSRVRKLYRRGLGSATEDAEALATAFLRFERSYGTRHDLDAAMECVEARAARARLAEAEALRRSGGAKGAAQPRKRHRNRHRRWQEDQAPAKKPRRERSEAGQRSKDDETKEPKDSPPKDEPKESMPPPPPRTNTPPAQSAAAGAAGTKTSPPSPKAKGPGSPGSPQALYVQSPGSPQSRLARSVSPVDKDGFKVPTMQPPQKRSRDASPKPPSPKPASPGSPNPAPAPHVLFSPPQPTAPLAPVAAASGPPPTGFVETKLGPRRSTPSSRLADSADEPASSASSVSHSSAQDDAEKEEARLRTAFVANLDYRLPEKRLRQFFAPVGRIVSIRLLGAKAGTHKGCGFVEFSSADAADAALQLDKTPIDGRPVFVNRDGERHGFEHKSQGEERNKLFVRNVPHSLTEAQGRELFQGLGGLREARLVKHKNGRLKGTAYLDFADEAQAAAAIASLDGKDVGGERPLSVALSNPPARRERQPETKRQGRSLLATSKPQPTAAKEFKLNTERRPGLALAVPRSLNASAAAASRASAKALERDARPKDAPAEPPADPAPALARDARPKDAPAEPPADPAPTSSASPNAAAAAARKSNADFRALLLKKD